MSGHGVPVSVVVPCFRCAATIERALDSVNRQTRAPAEILVVDDASDDGSVERLNGLAARIPALRMILLGSNQGPAGARNAGWLAATQPYLAFLDADDAWRPEKLERQFAWMEAHPGAVLTGHAIHEAQVGDSDALLRGAVRITGRMLLRSNRFQTSSVMLKRSIGHRFADGKRYCEDYLLWLEIVLGGGEAYFLDAALAVRFKAVYGDRGASSRLWLMERGELDALHRVWKAGLLGSVAYVLASAWSWLKFLRRLAVTRAR